MNMRVRHVMNSPSSRSQAEQEAAVWIGQRETGPWTDADNAAFDAWLNASMSHRAAYYRFRTIWKETGRLSALGKQLPDGLLSDAFGGRDAQWRKPLPPLVSREARTHKRPVFAAAAAILAVVAGAVFIQQNGFFSPGSYSTVTGGLQTVPMQDGSRVTLNTDSKVRITVDEKERRIELERGEAYFEAAKDPSRPFIVAVGNKRIVAIGTAFSVRREGDDVRIAVTEGSVRLESPNTILPATGEGAESSRRMRETKDTQVANSSPQGSDKNRGAIILAAGTSARAQGTDILVQKKPVSALEQDLTWRTGTLTFHETPLAQAVAEFNRYNEQQIVIEDPSIAAIQVGGVFRTTNLDRFIRLIEGPLPVHVTHDGNRILLSAK